MSDIERATMTIAEAARLLGLARMSAYRAAARGELPAIRVGRRLLVPRAAFERWLAGGGGEGGVPDDYDGFYRS